MSIHGLTHGIALASTEEWTASKLAQHLPVIAHKATCGEVFDWFGEHPDVPAAAIVDEAGGVHGLVNRLLFLSRYAQRYYPEVYGKRSVLALANTDPLLVEADALVHDVAELLVIEQPQALIECFVVTRGGRYLGIATGESLMRGKVALHQARHSELGHALRIATDANQAKSNFLALMSHELRTPLNAIIGFSEVLAGEMFGPLGVPRYREYAGDIHGAGRHLLALINDILDLSKAEAGKLDLHEEPVDICAVVQDCLHLMRERARDNGIGISHDCSGDLPRLLADPMRLKQMLLNLVSNAVKFTPAGGSIQIGALREPGGVLTLSVTDTGIGMSPEQIPVALQPFAQIDSPMSRKFEGTGLGLSMVKSFMEAHAGELLIESEPGQGTAVSLRFPASRDLGRQPRIAMAG